MKIKLLFLTAFLGLGQLVNAQTQQFNTKTYEPAANTVKVDFANSYTTSEQKTTEGNRMVVAYEQGLLYNFSLVSVYPATKSEKMDTDMQGRFLKLIGDQATQYQRETGQKLLVSTSLAGATGQTGFSTNFAIGDYTYQYRVIVVDNVYYMLSATSLTANKSDAAITSFLNSFSANSATTK